jgi:hypothetical protein
MLGEILTTLKTHQGNEIDVNVGRNVGRNYDLTKSLKTLKTVFGL